MIILTNAVVNPGAVMVHFHNTAVTNRAMMRSLRLDAFTLVAFINNLKISGLNCLYIGKFYWEFSKIKTDEITWSGRLLASRTDSSVSGIFSHTPGSENKLKLLCLKPVIKSDYQHG